MFDNDKLAAALTRIVKDPFDGQHLNIENLKFVKDENWIRFEVKSTLDVEKKDTTKKTAVGAKEKKQFFFEYNISKDSLVELKDQKKTTPKPSWANVSPDQQWVVFAKNFNLYWMDSANLRKATANEDDSTIVEYKLTEDGVENYGFGESYGETNVEKLKNKNKRKYFPILWSPNSTHFVLVKTDSRNVKDLWVINNVAEPRPTLETYKYHMPGEKEAPLRELLLVDFKNKKLTKINGNQFKDQEISLWNASAEKKMRDEEHRPSIWLGDDTKVYFSRTSRDLKKIDVCALDINSKVVKVVIEERMNTYVEMRKPALFNNGRELIHWSERDGWGHLYLYDSSGKMKGQITSGPWHVEDVEGVAG
jgi:dipeptidyl aminopeptidase/acylaminoacyl peptidase